MPEIRVQRLRHRVAEGVTPSDLAVKLRDDQAAMRAVHPPQGERLQVAAAIARESPEGGRLQIIDPRSPQGHFIYFDTVFRALEPTARHSALGVLKYAFQVGLLAHL